MKNSKCHIAKNLLEQFCMGYNNRDLTHLLNIMAHDIQMWGSGVDEYRVGKAEVEEQLKRDWHQSESGTIEILSFIPSPEEALWTAANCRAIVIIDGTSHVFEHLRGTITIDIEHGDWKISHMHTSFPDFRNQPGSSFPVMSALT